MSARPARFFTLPESRAFSERVAHEAQLTLAPLEERRFEGGEFKLRPLESVRNHTVFVAQSLIHAGDVSVSERFLRLLFLASGLRDGGAAHVVVLVPYLAFARKDRRTQPRDPIATRYVAELLEAAGATHLMALDVHNAAAFDNAFRIPTDHLTALPMMVNHFAKSFDHESFAVASPDVGGVKRAQIFRELLEARLQRPVELVFVEKRRVQSEVSGGTLVGNVEGKHVIVVDDLCATGGTLVRAAEACQKSGAVSVHAAVTHAPLQEGLKALIDGQSLTTVVITDSVGIGVHDTQMSPKLVCLSVAPLFGQAVHRVLQGRPLAPLLTHWPARDDNPG